jgi:hypothetical protein
MGGHGYNESQDGGDTWAQPDRGIERHYLSGLAVDPGDPSTVVCSCRLRTIPRTRTRPSTGGRVTTCGGRCGKGCHRPEAACGRCWQPTLRSGGLLRREQPGLFRSADAGVSWQRLQLSEPVTVDQAIGVPV